MPESFKDKDRKGALYFRAQVVELQVLMQTSDGLTMREGCSILHPRFLDERAAACSSQSFFDIRHPEPRLLLGDLLPGNSSRLDGREQSGGMLDHDD